MRVLWSNPATANRFENKHLLVVDDGMKLDAMVKLSYDIFLDRLRAGILGKRFYEQHNLSFKEKKEFFELKDTYGSGEIDINTMIVLSKSALKALESAIIRRGKGAWQKYSILNGLIFEEENVAKTTHTVSMVADVWLKIEKVGGNLEVSHLHKATTKGKIQQFANSKQITVRPATGSNYLGFQFTPTVKELEAKMTQLKPVAARG